MMESTKVPNQSSGIKGPTTVGGQLSAASSGAMWQTLTCDFTTGVFVDSDWNTGRAKIPGSSSGSFSWGCIKPASARARGHKGKTPFWTTRFKNDCIKVDRARHVLTWPTKHSGRGTKPWPTTAHCWM
uniref:Uncharacterized protein n=1 Tax=Magnusiomyces tetraspermus TaxID=1232584 RepID=A0A023UMC7_9ASCO|nr:hypothetical protein [Magnusiomyces tetraspermus]AHY04949.1 hypothetical protein [Magnusiomyces tetraspermus]